VTEVSAIAILRKLVNAINSMKKQEASAFSSSYFDSFKGYWGWVLSGSWIKMYLAVIDLLAGAHIFSPI
jgi:roadblock/LC7 domain-containing protein